MDILAAVDQSRQRDLLDVALILSDTELFVFLVALPEKAFFGLLNERFMRNRKLSKPDPPSYLVLMDDLVEDAIKYCCSPALLDMILDMKYSPSGISIPRDYDHTHLHIDLKNKLKSDREVGQDILLFNYTAPSKMALPQHRQIKHRPKAPPVYEFHPSQNCGRFWNSPTFGKLWHPQKKVDLSNRTFL